jgi:hypothetical protein
MPDASHRALDLLDFLDLAGLLLAQLIDLLDVLLRQVIDIALGFLAIIFRQRV